MEGLGGKEGVVIRRKTEIRKQKGPVKYIYLDM